MFSDQRYRELERLMAIEQAKELGFEDLQTARDLLAPPNLSQAREYVPPSDLAFAGFGTLFSH